MAEFECSRQRLLSPTSYGDLAALTSKLEHPHHPAVAWNEGLCGQAWTLLGAALKAGSQGKCMYSYMR